MHFSQRLAVIVLTCGLSTGLVGCGFHLKGTNPSIAPVAYSKMSLALPSNAEELEEKNGSKPYAASANSYEEDSNMTAAAWSVWLDVP